MMINMENQENNTPGAAVGSIIVIIILIAGAAFMLGKQWAKQPAVTATSTAIIASSTSQI